MIRSLIGSLRFLRMPRKATAAGFYAVNSGRRKGVVTSWAECESLVKGFSGAKYKKFNTLEEAENFVRGAQSSAVPSSTRKLADVSRKRPLPENTSVETTSDSSPKRARQTLEATNVPVVYTDGACSCNGKAGAKAGIGVFWGDGDPRNVAEPLAGKPTNNRAEIHAAVKAIRQAKEQGMKKIEIRTDSNFLVKSITKWIPGWQRKNWMTAAGKPVINKDDFTDLLEAAEGIDIIWTHVAGHAGIHGNEQADGLAVSGMLKGKSVSQ